MLFRSGWRAADVVAMYWIENVLVGLLNVPRILLAQDESGSDRQRPVQERLLANAQPALFFVLHYGLFCAVHGIVLIELFGLQAIAGVAEAADELAALQAMVQRWRGDPLALAGIVALLGSHLYSLIVNFLASGEYRRVDAGTMVERPYRRIAVIQVFAIACGALLQYFDSPVLAVAVFVVVKIVIDWHLHDRERVVLGESSIRGI